MAMCKVCGQDMLTAKGCKGETLHANGKTYKRIRMGAEGDFFTGEDKDTRCGDCNAAMGELHHWGCDCERCPACGGQLISCDCDDVYIEAR